MTVPNPTAFEAALQDAQSRAAALTPDPDARRILVDAWMEARRRRGVAELRGRQRSIEAVGRLGRAEPIEPWELEQLAETEETPPLEGSAAADPLQLVLDLWQVVPDLNPRWLRVGERPDDPRRLWRPTVEAMHRWPWVDMDTPTSINVLGLEVPDGEAAAAAVDAGDAPPPRWWIDLEWGAAAIGWTLARPVHHRPDCRAAPLWAFWLVADYLAEVTGGAPGWDSGRPRNPLTRNPLFAVRKGRTVTWSAEGCISLADVRRQYIPRSRVPGRRGLLPARQAPRQGWRATARLAGPRPAERGIGGREPGRRSMIVVPDLWPTWMRAQRKGGRRRASMDSFEDARRAGLEASIAVRMARGATRREKVRRGVLAGYTDAEIAGALQCSPKTVQRHRLAAGLTRPMGPPRGRRI